MIEVYNGPHLHAALKCMYAGNVSGALSWIERDLGEENQDVRIDPESLKICQQDFGWGMTDAMQFSRVETDELTIIKTLIRQIVTERADNLCWLDVYQKLAKFVGVSFDPLQLPTAQFLGNCTHYECSMRTGRDYRPDEVTQRIVLLEERIAGAIDAARRYNHPGTITSTQTLAITILKALGAEEYAGRDK